MLPLLLPLVTSLAPALTSWLFGPKAATATTAIVQAVQTVTGADPSTAEGMAAVQAVLARSPDQAMQLQTQLLALHAQMTAEADREADTQRQASVDELKTYLADTQSARARDVALRAGGGTNYRADIMLVAVTVGLLACIVSSATGHLDQGTFGLVAGIAGTLSGCLKDAFGFEFGSSRQSEAKSAIIAGLAVGRPAVGPADKTGRP